MDFEALKSRLAELMGEIGGSSIDEFRLETQVESIKDWSQVGTLHELENWYCERKQRCRMRISEIPLSECRQWNMDEETGWFVHASKEFFIVQGVRVEQSGTREVGAKGWDQPIFTQIGYDGGLLGLLRQRINGIPHYLVEAKAEPGNVDLVQISPTLQATFSNLKQAHGGRKPAFAEFFETPDEVGGQVHFAQWMSEDGGRLYRKRNRGMLVEVPESTVTDIPENFYWASLFQIKTLIKTNSWVNPHVRSIISHF